MSGDWCKETEFKIKNCFESLENMPLTGIRNFNLATTVTLDALLQCLSRCEGFRKMSRSAAESAHGNCILTLCEFHSA